MTPELTILALAGLLQVGQFCLYSVLANLQVPPKVALGPRDNAMAPTGYAGRAGRAMDNHYSALILFSIAVLVITLSDQSTSATQTAAWVYLIARILYVPAYLIGKGPWRSLIWFVGMAATTFMLVAALL
ncbi:MAPEG family protein [Octadecabacter sp.]|nr:MAPEG family protein [Octadecabacter sp.]